MTISVDLVDERGRKGSGDAQDKHRATLIESKIGDSVWPAPKDASARI